MPYPTDTGLADEQARKRQLYEDALDRFAGFEPGESQLTDDQIMARRAARGQAGAPGTSGAFQRQRPLPPFGQPIPGASTMPFEAVLAQLKARPGMIEHLEGIDLDGDGIPDIPFQPSPEMMAHPMGRMQWQAMLQSRQQASQMRRAQRKAVNNETLLAHLRANDPLFEQVHAKIGDFVRTLSPKLQRPFLRAVEETPGAYLDLYKEMRDLLDLFTRLGVQGTRHSFSHSQRDSGEGYPSMGNRLSGGWRGNKEIEEGRQSDAACAAERAALVKRVKAGGAREGDLLKYLELCGV
ncbi:MAG: hypothetical protein ACLGSA_14680 [Acidobacteriota bacterium]